MRGVQGASEKTQIERFHALSVRMGVAGPLKSVVRLQARNKQTT
jgi:hypothetical protein